MSLYVYYVSGRNGETPSGAVELATEIGNLNDEYVRG